MSNTAHLWAIGYSDENRAEEVRAEINRLGGAEQYLDLLDTAVVVRHTDGTITVDREKFSKIGNVVGCTTLGFLAGLIVAAPLAGAAVGALLGSAGSAIASRIGIEDAFIQDVTTMMQPGTSALFVLDDEGDMDVILLSIRGLGGTVLKTNVDLKRARLIQSTLIADAEGSTKPGTTAI